MDIQAGLKPKLGQNEKEWMNYGVGQSQLHANIQKYNRSLNTEDIMGSKPKKFGHITIDNMPAGSSTHKLNMDSMHYEKERKNNMTL